MITLYHDPRSYSCQKVQVYFSEKGIKWRSHPIDLLKQEHILDKTYRIINPLGTVPALQDGEVIICNSTEILEYVSKVYLQKSDVFFNSSLSAHVHDFCKEDERLHDPHIRVLSYYNLWMAGTRSDAENNRLLTVATKHPNKTRGNFLAKAVRGEITSEELESANTAIFNALSDMEEKLLDSQSGFIFGTEYTMADSISMVRLFRFDRLNIKIESLKEQYPLTAAFYEKMKQRCSFSELRK